MKPLLRKIDRALTLYLSPPFPITKEEHWNWEWSPDTPPPGKWEPPDGTETVGNNGFVLTPNIVCFQRGRYTPGIFEQFVAIDADRFKHEVEYVKGCIEGIAFDFLVVAMDKSTVISGCLVEFRFNVENRENPPYLYISSLCTHKDYGGRGLAHRIVDAVKTLGKMMIKQAGKYPSYTIPTSGLYVGLAVRRTNREGPLDPNYEKLINLYKQCGMSLRDGTTPPMNYRSFTNHSRYAWNLDSDETLTSMWVKIDNASLILM